MTDRERPPPGLRVIKRSNGRSEAYFVADRASVGAGYRPRTMRLKGNLEDPVDREQIYALCWRCWNDLQAWKDGIARGSVVRPGTIRALIDQYRCEPESPYHGLRQATRVGYDKYLDKIGRSVGDISIRSVTGILVRKWFKQWAGADDAGALKHHRTASYCVQMLRIVVRFGAEFGDKTCIDLAHVLSAMEFPSTERRSSAMTVDHVHAFVAKAHELKRPSLALALTLQFCCALRQKDVIGEWVDGQWEHGLRWGEHISADWRLTKPTSKSNGREVAEFDLRLIPLVMQELDKVPATKRIGPVILSELKGVPYAQRSFSGVFRKMAAAAGIPADVWNMDARAGAVTEAYDRGAVATDVMDMATHKGLAMNKRYDRGRLEKTSRVSIVRFGGEKK